MVLDDDATTRALLKIFLLPTEVEVVEVADPTAALEQLRGPSPTFSLLIVDYQMPGLTGLQVVAQLRAAGAQLPVIVLTGDDDQALHVKSLAFGANEFLRKPVTPGVLQAAIARSLKP